MTTAHPYRRLWNVQRLRDGVMIVGMSISGFALAIGGAFFLVFLAAPEPTLAAIALAVLRYAWKRVMTVRA